MGQIYKKTEIPKSAKLRSYPLGNYWNCCFYLVVNFGGGSDEPYRPNR